MKQKKQRFKIGDFIKVVQIPPDLKNVPGMDSLGVFQRALGKTFPIKGFGRYGHLELLVASKASDKGKRWKIDTIWIEPEFVIPARESSTKPQRD